MSSSWIQPPGGGLTLQGALILHPSITGRPLLTTRENADLDKQPRLIFSLWKPSFTPAVYSDVRVKGYLFVKCL